ncbi:MAG: bifunctional glutamate N-acetyltransferase/amino-acid acetyltransferase ArgJ [Chloroflexi bacterium]|nr:bifunctional glutamate N-acetyltransferase/amino-acid acetyltransferase ArgJ [Chloroflexota bacterium]
MENKIEFITGGTVTSPEGFFAGATSAGIKKAADSLDLGILYSRAPCATAGMFTGSKLKAAAVALCQQRLKEGKATALIVNSGCANAYTGKEGLADAEAMASLAAGAIGISDRDMLVASTGVTGQRLPMDKIPDAISTIVLSHDGGHELARAIMTTDTVPKEAAVTVRLADSEFTIGGVAKGSGMIHPNLATMFCFLTTDAAVELNFLRNALKKSVSQSLNMISVDGDTSPSDTVLLMANGLAQNKPITARSQQASVFQAALDRICIHFAKALARDGEGATRLIEATVSGAANITEARKAAKAIIGSNLVKTAVHGGDPNWGRIVAAVAQSGVELEESKLDVSVGGIAVLKGGKPLSFSEEAVGQALEQDEVLINVSLNLGAASATAWGCDLSEEYVTINSLYRT